MISSAGSRFVLAVELKSDGFDGESAHLIAEAKGVSSRCRRDDLVVAFFLAFKKELLPDDLASKLDLQRHKKERQKTFADCQ